MQFLDSFNTCMRGLAARMQLGKFKFLRGRDREWKEAIRKVHVFIDKHVEMVLGGQFPDRNETLQAERYILLNEMAKETRDPIDLRYQLLHVFFPAHDATGIAVSDIIFHLPRDPDRWAKLRLKVLTATSLKPLIFELLKSIKYLRYVFNESMRITRVPPCKQ